MPLRTESDDDLLACIREHNERALQELLSRYYVRLGEFSYSLLRRRDLAEEAVLNVFLQLWRRRETLVVNGVLKNYLFSAVGNQSNNLRKRQLRHPTVWLDDVASAQLVETTRPEDELLYRELQAQIEVVLTRLPPRRQLIFRMNRFEGLRYSEIAETLSVSEHTVQNHMVQAIKQLAQHLPSLRAVLKRDGTSDRKR